MNWDTLSWSGETWEGFFSSAHPFLTFPILSCNIPVPVPILTHASLYLIPFNNSSPHDLSLSYRQPHLAPRTPLASLGSTFRPLSGTLVWRDTHMQKPMDASSDLPAHQPCSRLRAHTYVLTPISPLLAFSSIPKVTLVKNAAEVLILLLLVVTVTYNYPIHNGS